MTNSSNSTPRKDSAVIFDFDGTLTKPHLDFDAIRREIGLGSGPILESLEQLSPEDRTRGMDILIRHETSSADLVEVQTDAIYVIDALRQAGHPVAILTRNAREPLGKMLVRFSIEVDCIRTREDGPIKPSPDGILSICKELGVDPRDSWMVGDYRFDIEAGNNARSTTVLFAEQDLLPQYAQEADHVIRSLSDLLPLLASA
ncbi:MAG: HAD family hydrolase [Planctomycetota bacterium]|jgi:HAD superfamily hydrolase (TIGR01509 family)